MIAVIAFTRKGAELGKKIVCGIREIGFSSEGYWKSKRNFDEETHSITEPLSEWVGNHFLSAEGFVFVGAVGIAVRAIAPWIQDKYKDPAVVVVDEKGQFVIPVLSGHVGGGNKLARQIAGFLDAVPVLTSATDVQQKFAVDVFAKENHLWISNRELAKQISAELLDGETVGIHSIFPIKGSLPKGCQRGRSGKYQVSIDIFCHSEKEKLFLVPKIITLGIGCRKGIPAEKLEDQVVQYLKNQKIWMQAVKRVATIEQKKNEPALLMLCRKFNWEFCWFSAEELNALEGSFSYSAFTEQTVGVGNVCERAAVRGCKGNAGDLRIKKQKLEGMTIAAAWKKEKKMIQF